MNRAEKLTLLKNAAANVVRGGTAALVAIALPPFLSRMMSPQSYGAWLLVLQLAALVGYLDFGIQTAVGRFVAYANERGDSQHRDRIVSTSFAALTIAGATAILASLVVATFLPEIFRQMPGGLTTDARVALVLVAGSLAIGLPASVFNGIFVGLQRYEVPAAIIGVSRILSAVLVVVVVKAAGGLILMGLTVALVNLGSYVMQYWMYRRATPAYRISKGMVSKTERRELFDYCLSLSIWSFAMLLVSGLDVSLVGYFQFDAVAYYAVAASLITFFAGVQNAAFTAMVPSTAVMQARGDGKALGCMMITATRYGTLLLLIVGIPLIFGANRILTLWVGSLYAEHGVRILQVLAAANIIRLSAAPYIMALVGTGQQRLVILTPLLEGLANLLASLLLGYEFGALGVAVGTFVGSLVGFGGNIVYNMPRTTGFEFTIANYLRDGLIRPLVCAIPAIFFVMVLLYRRKLGLVVTIVGAASFMLATLYFFWNWGLVGSERQKLSTARLVPQA